MLTGLTMVRSTRLRWIGAGMLALFLVVAMPMDAMADKSKRERSGQQKAPPHKSDSTKSRPSQRDAQREAQQRAEQQQAAQQKAERARAAKAAQDAKRAAQREAQRESQVRAAAKREAQQHAARVKRQAEEAAKRERAQAKREAELARKAAAAQNVSTRSHNSRSSGHDHDDHNHASSRQRADHHPLTVLEKYGKDVNGDGKHNHADHHVNKPHKATKHGHLAHHPRVREAIKHGSSHHSNHHSNNSKYRNDHRDRYDRDRYDHDRSRFSFGIVFGDRYATNHHRCSHGYTRTSCHICNPRYGYANRARVYVRPEPVVIERRTTVYEQPPVVVTPPPAPAPAPEPAVQYVNGWQLLRAKDPAGALKAFEDAISRDPNAGIHRIGCSIAGALLGDDDKAVLAMRDVVRFAPGSMIEAPVDGEIVGYYAVLIDKYQTREDTELARVDDAFMTAAVSYLKRDFALAHASVRSAQRLGDTHPTVAQLAKMVDYQRTYQRQP